jgi:hypothetical protein
LPLLVCSPRSRSRRWSLLSLRAGVEARELLPQRLTDKRRHAGRRSVRRADPGPVLRQVPTDPTLIGKMTCPSGASCPQLQIGRSPRPFRDHLAQCDASTRIGLGSTSQTGSIGVEKVRSLASSECARLRRKLALASFSSHSGTGRMRGTDGSNLSPSSGESGADLAGCRARPVAYLAK